MKTWILKNDLSRSPQTALRLYACGTRKNKHESGMDFINRPKHYFLARKLKSQLKSLSKLLTLDAVASYED